MQFGLLPNVSLGIKAKQKSWCVQVQLGEPLSCTHVPFREKSLAADRPSKQTKLVQSLSVPSIFHHRI